MNFRIITFTFTLLLSLPLFARDKTDVIVMKNGDHMTCEIKGLSAGVLSVKLSYVDCTQLGAQLDFRYSIATLSRQDLVEIFLPRGPLGLGQYKVKRSAVKLLVWIFCFPKNAFDLRCKFAKPVSANSNSGLGNGALVALH